VPDEAKRVELVSERPPLNRSSYIGLGLLASLVIGFRPLSDAFFGNGSFEGAVARFVVVVIFCIAASSMLGRLLDSAPEEDDEDVDGDGPVGEAGAPPEDTDSQTRTEGATS
jgi:hypothetical protein